MNHPIQNSAQKRREHDGGMDLSAAVGGTGLLLGGIMYFAYKLGGLHAVNIAYALILIATILTVWKYTHRRK